MEQTVTDQMEAPPECVVCGRPAVTIDRRDTPMCAKHAAIFITADRRETVADKGRIVR